MNERETLTPPVPRVVIHESLLAQDCPYTISVRQDKYAEFLRHCCISNDLISQHHLSIEPGGGLMHYGHFDWKRKKTTIYANPIWNSYVMVIDSVNDIVSGHGSFVNKLIVNLEMRTKRLPEYLKKAPRQRGTDYARKLILRAINRGMNENLFHETMHFKDGRRKILSLARGASFLAISAPIMYGSFEGISKLGLPVLPEFALLYTTTIANGFGSLYLNYYFLDVKERRARKFAKKQGADPSWLDIIRFEPKVANIY